MRPNTLLSLDEFRAAIGMMPWWFFGLSNTDALRVSAQCPQVTRLYAWQNDGMAGRYEILEAIAEAEAKLFRYLNYRVAPAYAEATIPWPRFGDPRFLRTGPWDASGRWLSIDLPEGYVQAIGVEARTLIQAGAALTFSDPDADGVNERFTVGPIATSVTDPAEIALYFVASDRVTGDDLDESDRVRPVDVTIAGGTVTIRGASWLLTRPIREESPVIRDALLDPDAPGVLATTVDVYRYYTNPSGTTEATAQAVITWETRPCHGWMCCCDSCLGSSSSMGSPDDPAATARAVGRVAIRNARLGLVAPAEALYDQTTGIWAASGWSACDEPDRVTVRYLAGYPRPPDGQRIDPEWRTVVARLAAAEMGRPICACEDANRELYRWQFDLSRAAGLNDEQYSTSPDDLDNPFGTRRGQVQAWRWVLRRQQSRGLLAG